MHVRREWIKLLLIEKKTKKVRDNTLRQCLEGPIPIPRNTIIQYIFYEHVEYPYVLVQEILYMYYCIL